MRLQQLQADGLERTMILLGLFQDRAAHCHAIAADEEDHDLARIMVSLADVLDEVVGVTKARIDRGDEMGGIARMLLAFSAAKDLSLLIR